MPLVLGVDPGLAAIGYGIVETDGTRHRNICFGEIKTAANQALPERLNIIFDFFQQLLQDYEVHAASVETLYFAKNITSAIPVAQARGVILLSIIKKNIPVFEYTPLVIKQSIVGGGRATKEQVQRFVQTLLGMAKAPKPDHAADALAAAICHIHNIGGPGVS